MTAGPTTARRLSPRGLTWVNAAAVRPNGKAVFVDDHRPHWAHSLKGVTSLVFDPQEPFAKGLWARDICDYASDRTNFSWSQQSYSGGLFQKVVAQRRA